MYIKFRIQPAAAGEGIKVGQGRASKDEEIYQYGTQFSFGCRSKRNESEDGDEPEYGLVHVVIDSGVYIGEPFLRILEVFR